MRHNRGSDTHGAHRRELSLAIEQPHVQREVFQRVAIKNGFINKRLRGRAWRRLLGSSREELEKTRDHAGDVVQHPDMEQVQRDVERSLHHIPEDSRGKKRHKLGTILNAIASRNPALCYYQGLHDVCAVVYQLVGEPVGFIVCEQLCLSHLRSYMDSNMQASIDVLNMLFPLIRHVDEEVYEFFMRAEAQSFYALSWVITWFSHDVSSLAVLGRLFDFFISSHPLMSLYLSAVCTAHWRDELLLQECDGAMLHSFCLKLPNRTNLVDLLPATKELFDRYPPDRLQEDGGVVFENSSCFTQYALESNTEETAGEEVHSKAGLWRLAAVAVSVASVVFVSQYG